ncbi:hypothetical protein COHA_001895 [Chlorella ohadii]|uniref:F-box domain-containing protein n=1 Tax=Chlorella ohadii TaxID=2649997 RepID=A0AAD5H942_9CHLO|nr:hypothetical protein COHA_001895 [Chlorella ohadii]
MDSLDAAAAALVASCLLDERDLASLRCTNRFWRDVLSDNPGLWSQLLARRFGVVGTAGQGSSSGAANPERRFQQLAMAALRRPVAGLDRLIWLDGTHLQRIDDPSSPYGTTVLVANVWWLELGGRFHGVLPGCYRLAWRLRLEPGFYLDRLHLFARQEQPSAGPAAASASGCEAREGVQDWEWTLEEAAIAAARAQAAAGQAGLAWFALGSAAEVQQAHSWHGWFEVAGEPFEVAQLCSLWVELRETQQWKRGIVLDSVRLVRQQAQQAQQEGQPQAAEAQAAAAGQEGGDESVWARVRRAARALGLMGP